MNTKLTLTLEDTTIAKAKEYAKSKKRSLSDLIEDFLKVITNEDKTQIELSPKIKQLKGAFKAPKSLDYKKELSQSLSDKYL